MTVKWYLVNEKTKVEKDSLSESQIEFIQEKDKDILNRDVDVFAVPYIFYSRHYQKWKENTAYMTQEEIDKNLEKTGKKKKGYETWREK